MNDEFDYEQILSDVAELAKSMESRNNEIDSLRKSLVQAEELARQLRSKREDLLDLNRRDRMEKSRLEQEAMRAQRLAEAEKNRRKILSELREREEALERDTAGAPWREFAFEHQISGGKRLAVARRGVLADKRGLGKTLTSLIWLDMVKAKRILVLAPNDVVPQFEDEIRQWAPGRTIFSLRGLPPIQREMIYPMLNMVKEFIITLNYEAWRRDKSIVDDLVRAGIDSVVLDEAHRIKSSSKQTAKGVFQVIYSPNYCPNCNQTAVFKPWLKEQATLVDHKPWQVEKCPACSTVLESTVKNTLCMTGTPIINKPQEMFSILFITDWKRFNTEKQYLKDYCYSPAPGKWRFLQGGLDRLTDQMSEYFVQRTREDAGIVIPPPAINMYYIDKDFVNYKKQYQAEKDLREAAMLQIEESGESMPILHLLEIILRERQVMSWPAGVLFRDPKTKEIICNFDVEESQKMDEAMDLLKDLCEEEERVIVWSKFKPPLYEMMRRIQKENVSATMATGDQSSYTKEAIRRDFDLKTAPEQPRWQVCFATYDAFGTGVNLNAARHMIMLDDEWSPGMQDQAIGRIDRLNSVDQANVHIFRVRGSIDMFMEQLIEEKRKLTDGFEDVMTPKELIRRLKELD